MRTEERWLEPGRELDGIVAEEVMNLSPDKIKPSSINVLKPHEVQYPKYSTDLSAAWEVVEKLFSQGIAYCIERAHEADFPTVHFLPKHPPHCSAVHFIEDMERVSESAKSLPHAICLAALRTVKVIL